jgi:hypothetical protein
MSELGQQRHSVDVRSTSALALRAAVTEFVDSGDSFGFEMRD